MRNKCRNSKGPLTLPPVQEEKKKANATLQVWTIGNAERQEANLLKNAVAVTLIGSALWVPNVCIGKNKVQTATHGWLPLPLTMHLHTRRWVKQ